MKKIKEYLKNKGYNITENPQTNCYTSRCYSIPYYLRDDAEIFAIYLERYMEPFKEKFSFENEHIQLFIQDSNDDYIIVMAIL